MNEKHLPRLGALFSGGGRTLENLARKVVEGSLPLEIAVAVSSHPGAGGIERAEKAGIPVHVVDYRQHRQKDFSARITEILDSKDKIPGISVARRRRAVGESPQHIV